MNNDVRLKVKAKYIKKFKSGYPLITKEAIMNLSDVNEEGTIVTLVDEGNAFLAKGYYGQQNKGFGWVLSHDENERFDQRFFENKLRKAFENRESFYQSSDTTAFRVFNGEGDGIGGFTIEYFDGYYLINWYSKGIYHYREYIIQALMELVEFKAIYQKKRFDTKGTYIEEDDFVTGERGEFPIIVKDGKKRFLRFNHSSERDLKTIESEIDILLYLQDKSVRVVQPVKSSNDNYIEVVETELGTFYAVVFEALEGTQFESEDLNSSQFYAWGKALGHLHQIFKEIPEEYLSSRKSWRNHLNQVRETLPKEETAAIKELDVVENWAMGLTVSKENFGLIHFDFEQDNLCWENDEIGILDFDDCASYWYVADIAFGLRDLFEEKVDFDNPLFQEFLHGYESKTKLDRELLNDLPMFYRLHKLFSFTRLLRAVDVVESPEHPEWLNGLSNKLVAKIDSYRRSFENN